jgi:hypothetical protein
MALDNKEIIGVRTFAIGAVATALLTIFGGNYIHKAKELGSYSEANKYIIQEVKKAHKEIVESRPIYHWGIG